MNMPRLDRARYEKYLITFSRAVTVGVSYVAASPIPGLTSSFVAIFTALLAYDLFLASLHPPFTSREWRGYWDVLRPKITGTAISLAKGISLGAFFGLLCLFGMPATIGAVLTSGLAYVWALSTRHLISSYVSILSGLAIFERLITVEAVRPLAILQEGAMAILLSTGGTFAALLVGWAVGLVSGGITRSLLTKPYRSLKSAAYDLPLEMRPFNEILHIGDGAVIMSADVEEGAPVADKPLSETGLREEWETTVLSVKREGEEIVLPKGRTVLLPGDQVMVLTGRTQFSDMLAQFDAPDAVEQEAL